MGDKFVLEEPAQPKVVYTSRDDGTLLPARHLTDDHEKTLCGRGNRPFVLAERHETATCKTCVKAVDGWARVRREFR